MNDPRNAQALRSLASEGNHSPDVMSMLSDLVAARQKIEPGFRPSTADLKGMLRRFGVDRPTAGNAALSDATVAEMKTIRGALDGAAKLQDEGMVEASQVILSRIDGSGYSSSTQVEQAIRSLRALQAAKATTPPNRGMNDPETARALRALAARGTQTPEQAVNLATRVVERQAADPNWKPTPENLARVTNERPPQTAEAGPRRPGAPDLAEVDVTPAEIDAILADINRRYPASINDKLVKLGTDTYRKVAKLLAQFGKRRKQQGATDEQIRRESDDALSGCLSERNV